MNVNFLFYDWQVKLVRTSGVLAAAMATLGAYAQDPPRVMQNPSAREIIERLTPAEKPSTRGLNRGVTIERQTEKPAEQPGSNRATEKQAGKPAEPPSTSMPSERQAEKPAEPPSINTAPEKKPEKPAEPPSINTPGERQAEKAAELPSINMAINFEFASAKLTPDARIALDNLGQALGDPVLRDSKFRIAGHTDAVGGDAANLALSRQRAQSVAEYLVRQHNVAQARLAVEGRGRSQLLDANNPTSAINRRVQIENLGNTP